MDDESINANDFLPEGMTDEEFSFFVYFENDLGESSKISDPQIHQNKIDENKLDEEFTVKSISSHIEINNAC